MRRWHKPKSAGGPAAAPAPEMETPGQSTPAPSAPARWLAARGARPAVVAACLAVIAVFVWQWSNYYLPGKGFSYLIAFGGEQDGSRLSKLQKVDYYVARASAGYDAQYYVQIAMDPSLRNQGLRRAVDSLGYRARRILLPAVAYVAGFGQPSWILQAYALQNGLCWVALACMLWWWFPPVSWENFLRWVGVLASFGLCTSVIYSLPDGPSLLLIALGVRLLEKGRPWLATAVLAVTGLAKETNLLGAAGLAAPPGRAPRAWLLLAVRGLLVAAPLALWIAYIATTVGPATDAGLRNFAGPGAGYARKWLDVVRDLPGVSGANPSALWSLFMLVSLTVQFLFLVLRPRWQEAWWRIGASYALLMVFLGHAVWEGYPGASSRVLLPMQLAFNVLVPAGRSWTIGLLLAGNLTMFAAPSVINPPVSAGYLLNGPRGLVRAADGTRVSADYTGPWYQLEQLDQNFWCWTTGDSGVRVRNPHPFPVKFRLRFSVGSSGDRRLALRLNGADLWQADLRRELFLSVSLDNLVLQPGENRLEFHTDRPGQPSAEDARPLAFSLYNLRFDLVAPAGGP